MKVKMNLRKLFKSDLFSRGSARWLTILNVSLLGLFIFYLIYKVRARDFAVPIRYSSINEFTQLGRWYWHYLMGVFLAVSFMINLWLARHLAADENEELKRLSTKVVIFQTTLSALVFTVTYYLFSASSL